MSESPSCLCDEFGEAVAWDDVAVERFGEYAPLRFGGRPEVALWLHETHCCGAERWLAPMPPARS